MDHLKDQAEITENFPQCPYFALELYRLGITPPLNDRDGGFEGFRERFMIAAAASAVHLNQPGHFELLRNCMWQEWLYFALMYEIWGVFPESHDFLPPSNPFVVTSARLNQYYANASVLLSQMPSDEARIEFLDRTRPALVQAGQEMKRDWRKMDPRLATSILLLIDTLNSWRTGQYEDLNHEVFNDTVPLNRKMAQSLLSWDAWCPAEVERLPSDSALGWNSVFLASRLRRDRVFPPNHDECPPTRCRYQSQAQPANMLRHVSPESGCKCGMIGPSVAEMVALLQRGESPVLEIPLVDPPEQLQIRETLGLSQCRGQFVAISHVWAHGLGNPHGNELRRCQLLRILNYARNYAKPLTSETTGSVKLWIDTLCVPRGDGLGEARKQALQHIESVYASAQSVLVLDHELLSASSSPWTLTAWLKFLSSDWMQRVWTLKEGLLARSLWLQFSDRAVRYEDVVTSNNFSMEGPIEGDCEREMQTAAAVELIGFEDRREFSLHAAAPATSGQVVDLDSIWSPLRRRYTTNPGDEYIVLALLMRQDASAIWDIPLEQRMPQILGQLDFVPAGIIFVDGVRCQTPGFRWAPSYILGTGSMVSNGLSQLVHGGLLGKYAGIFLESPVVAEGTDTLSPTIPSPFWIKVATPDGGKEQRAMSLVVDHLPESSTDAPGKPPWSGSLSWAIILETPMEPLAAVHGVLVERVGVLGTPDGAISCHWHCRVKVQIDDSGHQGQVCRRRGMLLNSERQWFIH